MSSYVTEEQLRQKLDAALQSVRTVLHQNRAPQFAGDVHHQYEDKFLLAEFVTRAACGAVLNSLEVLGLDGAGLRQMKEWSRTKAVTLELRREEQCTFVRKTSREEESKTKQVTKIAGVKMENKTVTTIVEWFWDVEVSWELCAYSGTEKEKRVTLVRREGAVTQVKTLSETAPHPKVAVKDSIACEATWLLQCLDEELRVAFKVNRNGEGCHTPRRNKEVERAVGCLEQMMLWCSSIASYFEHHIFPIQQKHNLDLPSLRQVERIFVPVVPLLEAVEKNEKAKEQRLLEVQKDGGEEKEGQGQAQGKHLTVVAATNEEEQSKCALPLGDLEAFLGEERRGLAEKKDLLAKTFPVGEGEGSGKQGLITTVEGLLVVVVGHLREIGERYLLGVGYIEGLLRKQLVGAIGKEVGSEDFGAYMRFHNRKLFQEEVGPRGFCYSVRRGKHSPEGVVSIEAKKGMDSEPVVTVVRRLPKVAGEGTMRFALNAATTVSLGGERYVHAYIGHRFSTEAMPELELVARARQFSGYILLLGRIGGRDLFLPQHAMLVQNKDDLKIPLMLDEIPTPQEFQDAIESLSPEQQRFAQAYRSMQLEATLFAVCVVQIKPQLERVLNLPPDSLTKEIKLTQDLLQLFIDYQISSDLLAFKADPMEDEDTIPGTRKLHEVKEHVAALQQMLKQAKERELAEQRLVNEKKRLEACSVVLGPSDVSMTVDTPRAPIRRPSPKPPEHETCFGFFALVSMCCCSTTCCGSVSDKPVMNKEAMRLPVPVPVKTCSILRCLKRTPTTHHKPESVKKALQGNKKTQHHDPESEGYDISSIPHELEARYKEYDEDNCLRPTIVGVGGTWKKTFQKNLLTKPEEATLGAEEQRKERNKAFDVLDALTRSGALGVEEADLHVVVAATHCFDLTLMDTVVQRSVNPVEKVERSTLIVASTVHQSHPTTLVKQDQLQRLTTYSTKLMEH
eukprot:TRINITY_DN16417_c1_g1_i4.p1 TRINITY_DN16417_c1_g1~~TRINITY_DN16417_c1_g1_i4.p1  ORF type:complete len:962 (+),score=350.13 TRINITY_DN16417_c1_g1_i4:32-2917(+)